MEYMESLKTEILEIHTDKTYYINDPKVFIKVFTARFNIQSKMYFKVSITQLLKLLFACNNRF